MKTFNPKEFTKGAIAENAVYQLYECGYDDITFEGILCSACNDATTGERTYFTVNKTGKALSSFAQIEPKSLAFDIVMKDANTLDDTIIPYGAKPDGCREMMSNGKPRIVEVTRFFRTWDWTNGQISNFGGMVAICVIDYALKLIKVYPSFCHPTDNFSKTLGLEIARNNQEAGNGFVVEYLDGIRLRGCVEYGFENDCITWLTPKSERTFTKALERFVNE